MLFVIASCNRTKTRGLQAVGVTTNTRKDSLPFVTSQRLWVFQIIVQIGFGEAKEVKVRLIISLFCRQAGDAGYSLKKTVKVNCITRDL